MRKITLILGLLLALPLGAQVSNPSIIPVSTAPSGSCTQTLPIQLKTPDGTLYSCQNGTWAEISGGGGGSLPASAVVVGSNSSSQGVNNTSYVQIYACAPGNGLACNGTTDDTAAINTLLSAGNVHLLFPANTTILIGSSGTPITMQSNDWLDATNSTTFQLYQSATSGTMLINADYAPATTVASGGSMTSGSTTLTCTGCNFTSGSVGQTVAVGVASTTQGSGAGSNGYGPLIANITAYTSSTQVTVSVAAQYTVSGVQVQVFNRNSNIRITGGIWARGSVAGSGVPLGVHTIVFRHVDGGSLSDLTVSQTAGKYAVDMGDTTRINLSKLYLNVSSDGVHINGPAQGITIRDISGTIGDDGVALTAGDYPTYEDVCGNISVADIENDTVASATAALDLVGGPGLTLSTIGIRHIVGMGAGATFEIRSDSTYVNTTLTDASNIIANDIQSGPTSTASQVVDLYPTKGRNITVTDVGTNSGSTTDLILVSSATIESLKLSGMTLPSTVTQTVTPFYCNGSTLTSLVLDNILVDTGAAANNLVQIASCTITGARFSNLIAYYSSGSANIQPTFALSGTSTLTDTSIIGYILEFAASTTLASNSYGLVNIPSGTTVSNMDVIGLHADFASADTNTSNVVAVAGTLTHGIFTNSQQNYGKGFFYIASGATVGQMILANYAGKNLNRLGNFYANSDLTLSGVSMDTLANAAIYTSGATITIRGAGIDRVTSWAGLQRAASETVNVYNPDFPVDISMLANTAGERAFNTNTTYGPAAPMIDNGSYWVPIASGAFTGVTGSIGGSALAASCATGTATVNGATTSMAALANAVTASAPDTTGAFRITAQVTSSNTVTVSVCGTGTPTASTYNVRVN